MKALGYKRRLDFLDNLYYSLNAEYNRRDYTSDEIGAIESVICIIMDRYDELKKEAESYDE